MFLRAFSVGALFLAFALTASANPPAWLKGAAAYPVQTYARDVPAVVLHDEEHVTLGTDGKITTRENHAVKLLDREGRNFAIARAFYLVSSGRVREIEAWLIKPNGSVTTYDKKSILDVIADADDVYNEGRLKVIDGSRDAQPGDVFGYTVLSEDSPLFYQDIWQFQGRLPTIVSRYTLTLPRDWTAGSKTFNHAEVQPAVTGSSYVWELRNLPPIPPEPMSPSVINLAPRVAVNYSPQSGSNTVNRTFADWLDVSRWATALYDPQVVIDDTITRKALELTTGLKTEFEKISAIGHFVQNLQYISIDIGVGHGNGYKPRSSSLVMNRGYGDCKDKANLMRAMLKTLGIEAYPIAIYSGDPTYVRAEWASPRQFNHCIIAVKVSDSTVSSTIIDHPSLGRLLIFDATDPFTPVGDLPDYLQGSYGLIIAGEKGGLAEMPVTPADADLLERRIEAKIDVNGELSGTIFERASGQSSTAFRSEVRQLSAGDYRKAIEGWLTRGATGAKLIDLSMNDKPREASFDLNLEFATPRYGQVMAGRLLVFKPVVVGRRNAVALTEKKRAHPVQLHSRMMKETAVFSLPEGFEIDEMPTPVNLEAAFGSYRTQFEVIDGKLHFTRTLETKRKQIPTAEYESVRSFYAKMLDAEQGAVVLIKK
jgi:hypothetical protein